ncbi:MAG: DUF2252 family protein [Myxococcales bacterium]|nr:DUF2252 family protein [Myxococcales bacterium]
MSTPRPGLAIALTLGVGVGVGVGACAAPGDDARRGFVLDVLTRDNQRWLDRAPALVAAKYQRMAARTFDFFRGSAALYWRDVTSAGRGATPSAFADEAGAWVWIVGDPHLENLGTFRRPDGTRYVDWNDYDAATRGPWWLDLRRLCGGLALAADDAAVPALADTLVELAATAYAAEMVRLADGGAPTLETRGPVVEALLADAATAGAAQARLADYTRLTPDGARVMFFGEVAPPAADGSAVDTTVPLTTSERAEVDAVIAGWRTTASTPAGALLGVSRRLGAGLASYPAPRYYALFAGATASVDDDLLVELKEAGPPPVPAPPPAVALGVSDGARVALAQRIMGAAPDGDALLGSGDLGPRSFRLRARSGDYRGVELAALADDADGLRELAAVAGRLLAQAHARGPTVAGDAAVTAIAPRVRGRTAALVAELVAVAAADAATARADAAGFAATLVEAGPLAGATP